MPTSAARRNTCSYTLTGTRSPSPQRKAPGNALTGSAAQHGLGARARRQRRNASANPACQPGYDRDPVSPTASMPPPPTATSGGTPSAIASSSEKGSPSRRDENTKRSAAARNGRVTALPENRAPAPGRPRGSAFRVEAQAAVAHDASRIGTPLRAASIDGADCDLRLLGHFERPDPEREDRAVVDAQRRPSRLPLRRRGAAAVARLPLRMTTHLSVRPSLRLVARSSSAADTQIVQSAARDDRAKVRIGPAPRRRPSARRRRFKPCSVTTAGRRARAGRHSPPATSPCTCTRSQPEPRERSARCDNGRSECRRPRGGRRENVRTERIPSSPPASDHTSRRRPRDAGARGGRAVSHRRRSQKDLLKRRVEREPPRSAGYQSGRRSTKGLAES